MPQPADTPAGRSHRPAPAPAPTAAPRTVGLVARGALIGAAEVVPGVSGGTIALVVGVYDDLIRSAGHLVRAAVGVLRRAPREERRGHLAQVHWGVVLPVLVGMFAAVVLAARLLEPLLEDHPVQARALFAGLILASLVVPARMVGGRWRPVEVVVAAAAAALAAVLTGIPPAADVDPPLLVVALAASVAVCALVLPGVSGSFLLLTVGLYAPTLAAVNDRDLRYLAVFAAGALVGLSVFVAGLQWLLQHRRRITLVVMTGLMAGSLRALWPWQDEGRGLLAPDGDEASTAALLVLGAVVVLGLLAVERRRLADLEVLTEPMGPMDPEDPMEPVEPPPSTGDGDAPGQRSGTNR